jgi:hypothetical protein
MPRREVLRKTQRVGHVLKKAAFAAIVGPIVNCEVSAANRRSAASPPILELAETRGSPSQVHKFDQHAVWAAHVSDLDVAIAW